MPDPPVRLPGYRAAGTGAGGDEIVARTPRRREAAAPARFEQLQVTSLRSHAELGDEERTLKELTVIDAERPFIAAAELDGLRRVLRTGRRPAG